MKFGLFKVDLKLNWPPVWIYLQFQFYLRPGGSAGLQPSGRGADTYDEPEGFVRWPPVQRNHGRTDADVEERGILRPLQGLLAKLAATGALEHHRILIHSNTAAFRGADAAFHIWLMSKDKAPLAVVYS